MFSFLLQRASLCGMLPPHLPSGRACFSPRRGRYCCVAGCVYVCVYALCLYIRSAFVCSSLLVILSALVFISCDTVLSCLACLLLPYLVLSCPVWRRLCALETTQVLPFPLDQLTPATTVVEAYASDAVLKAHCLVREYGKNAEGRGGIHTYIDRERER